MLPDFPMPVTIAGTARQLVARDVAVGVFFFGFPNAVPLIECWQRDSAEGRHETRLRTERWLDGLLTRVIVAPALTLELVRRLGPARDETIAGYFAEIGFTARPTTAADDGPPPESGPLLRPDRIEPERLAGAERRRAFVTVPEPNLRKALRMVSARTQVPPHVIWGAWAISEWIFTWRILLQDGLTRRDRARRAAAINDPDLPDEVPAEALALEEAE